MFTKNIINFQKLSQLPYFTVEHAAAALSLKVESASVFCSRYVKNGLITKLKNNFYTSSQKLENLNQEELVLIANILQVPSYVSFMSALVYYGISTQVQRDFIESCSLKRSVEYDAKGVTFKYYRLKKELYFDFIRTNGLFIATIEKSFIDSAYLYSFGKYKFDISSLDLDKLNKARLKKLIKFYPEKTRKVVKNICRL